MTGIWIVGALAAEFLHRIQPTRFSVLVSRSLQRRARSMTNFDIVSGSCATG
jgi:hypothetical protein